jgi:acyl-coenzyme A synthetase/AMP-(fatty) acid ligase
VEQVLLQHPDVVQAYVVGYRIRQKERSSRLR